VRTGRTARPEIAAAAVFVFIGARPAHEFCEGVLTRDPGGFIYTGLDLVTDGRPPAGWPPGRLPARCSRPASPESSLPANVRHGSSKRVRRRRREGAWWRSSSFTSI
jgi:thioredoxin reductase (NADPH)